MGAGYSGLFQTVTAGTINVTPEDRTVDFSANIVIDKHKIEDYILNPNHELGKHKAKIFEKELGITKEDSEYLIKQIKENLTENNMELIKEDKWGKHYRADINIKGLNDKIKNIRINLIKEKGQERIRMTTAYVKKER
ncbi:MAG: hypothetical protein LBM93_07100 [Oscillospiraceae bacterium]|jgi:filamentous hemagglutinin|nr:hypothetical protein [Oscillospiraceae bacterium]